MGTEPELLDQLVGTREQRGRYCQPERLGGLEVDKQLELDRGLDWKLSWFLALEDLIDIRRRAPKIMDQSSP